MKIKVIFRNFLPLIIALIGAFVFFASYNRYLLDTSLVNLKISLRKLEGAGSLAEAKEIRGILDSAFLTESAKQEFDLASALTMELGKELTEEISSEKQEKNKKYIDSMAAAAEIDAASNVIASISKDTQIEDAKQFIQEVIARKKKGKSFLASKLDDFIIAFNPSEKRSEPSDLRRIIEQKKKQLTSFSEEALQAEYLKIARLYLRLEDYGNTLAYIGKILKLDPKTPLALTAKFYLGILYKVKGDYQEASAIFNEIKEELPEDWESFSAYQEASSLYSIGKTEEALALYEKNFDKNPSQEIRQLSQFRAGYIYLHDLKNPEAASAAFNKLGAAARSSRFTNYYENKVKLDLAAYYAYEGFRLLKEGYKTSLGEKYTEALAQFDLALKVSYDLDLAYSGKSLAYNLLNKSEDALKEAEKVKQLPLQRAETKTVLGYIYYNLGMTDKAISEYKASVEIDPNLYISQYNLGTLYIVNKDYAKAKKCFDLVIKTNPLFAQAYNNLGYVYWLEGNYKKAADLLQKAVALDSEYIEASYNLGVISVSMGSYERAQKAFTKVESLQTGYRKTSYYLDRIKELLGY